jgi:hypothetical protein
MKVKITIKSENVKSNRADSNFCVGSLMRQVINFAMYQCVSIWRFSGNGGPSLIKTNWPLNNLKGLEEKCLVKTTRIWIWVVSRLSYADDLLGCVKYASRYQTPPTAAPHTHHKFCGGARVLKYRRKSMDVNVKLSSLVVNHVSPNWVMLIAWLWYLGGDLQLLITDAAFHNNIRMCVICSKMQLTQLFGFFDLHTLLLIHSINFHFHIANHYIFYALKFKWAELAIHQLGDIFCCRTSLLHWAWTPYGTTKFHKKSWDGTMSSLI